MDTLSRIKALKVHEHIDLGSYTVVKVKRNLWRLRETCGDWIMSGDAVQVAERVHKANTQDWLGTYSAFCD